MKIAVLGAGRIGGTLAKKWATAGHTIRLGVRNAHKPEVQELLKTLGTNASASSIAEAINFGDVVLFAIPAGAMEAMITSNANALDGKIVIDATNNMSGPSMNSLATFAARTPHAKAYRAFSGYGWENFEDPMFGSLQADLFFCGPDGEARSVMEQLIAHVGLSPVYIGGSDQAPVLENVTRLWFALAFGQNLGRHLAFKVLTD